MGYAFGYLPYRMSILASHDESHELVRRSDLVFFNVVPESSRPFPLAQSE